MAIDPSAQNDSTPDPSAKDQILTDLSSQSPLTGTFDTSIEDWRSALKTMTAGGENIQLAALTPADTLTDNTKPNLLGPGPDIRIPASETHLNLERFMSFTQATKPQVTELPVGGKNLEGKSKDVVTSWYKSRDTAMMERFDPNSLTAAHRTLPFNTIVDLEFYNPKTGQTKIVTGVRINNDGPHVKGNDESPHVGRKPRELDVSPRVARELGLTDQGVDVGMVKMTIRQWGDNRYANGGVHPAGTDFRNKGRELDKYWGRSNFSIYS